MKTNNKLMNEFSVEELETRYEMKTWEIMVCTGSQCPSQIR